MTPATDPVGSGFVKTLAEPGTNITGLANMFGDLTEKSVELLHTILPAAKRVAILMSTNPTHPDIYTATQVAAQRFGLLTVPIIARTADDLDEAFQAIRSSRCDAVLVLADPIRPRIVTYATSASTVQISPQYGVGRLDM
jgi:putative ABC transport system substrate-binding protein